MWDRTLYFLDELAEEIFLRLWGKRIIWPLRLRVEVLMDIFGFSNPIQVCRLDALIDAGWDDWPTSLLEYHVEEAGHPAKVGGYVLKVVAAWIKANPSPAEALYS